MNGNTLYNGFEPKFKPLDEPCHSRKRKDMGAIVNDKDGVRLID